MGKRDKVYHRTADGQDAALLHIEYTEGTGGSKPVWGPNEVVVSGEAMIDTELLLMGLIPLNALSFHNLCSILEVSVLSSKVFLTLEVRPSGTLGPLSSELHSAKILDRSPRYLNWLTSKRSIKDYCFLYPADNPAQHRFGLREDLIKMLSAKEKRDNLRSRIISDWPREFSDSLSKVFELADFAQEENVQVIEDALWRPISLHEVRSSSISADLGKQFAQAFQLSVERAHRHLGLVRIPIPPLVTTVLSRCKSRSDIPKEIVNLRDEHAELHRTLTDYQARVQRASSVRERLQLEEELDRVWSHIVKGFRRKDMRLAYRGWEAIKPFFTSDSVKQAANVIEVLLKWWEKKPRSRFNGFYDIWKKAIESDYPRLISGVFKEEINTTDLRRDRYFDELIRLGNMPRE